MAFERGKKFHNNVTYEDFISEIVVDVGPPGGAPQGVNMQYFSNFKWKGTCIALACERVLCHETFGIRSSLILCAPRREGAPELSMEVRTCMDAQVLRGHLSCHHVILRAGYRTVVR